MRTIILALAISIFSLACGAECDDSPAPDTSNAHLIATYKLTTAAIPNPVDMNGDGNHSANLMDESDCYQATFLTLNSDGSCRMRISIPVLSSPENCSSETQVGNWSAAGNSVLLLFGEDSRELTFDTAAGSLTHIAEVQYHHTSDNGELIALNGEVAHIFKK